MGKGDPKKEDLKRREEREKKEADDPALCEVESTKKKRRKDG
jgi:hypothetical protein